MSTVNIVRFFVQNDVAFKPDQLQKLVHLAYLAARDRELYPQEILIRASVHASTRVLGKYKKDRPHATLCYKDAQQVQDSTHVASHSYVVSMDDWTYVKATHHAEKPDNTRKQNKENTDVWPEKKKLKEVTSIAYSHLADYMEDWINSSEAVLVGPSAHEADSSLAAATSSMSFAGGGLAEGQQSMEIQMIDVESDIFVVVEAKAGGKLTLRLTDGSTVKVQATGWEDAYVAANEGWKSCYLYVGEKSGGRYWAWTLEDSKEDADEDEGKKAGAKGKKKDEGRDKKGQGNAPKRSSKTYR